MSERIYQVRGKAEAIWKKPLLRQYTDHTVDHSLRVIQILDRLTDLLDPPLTDDEAYVLLCSAFLHDIGMQQERFFDMDVVEELYSETDITRAMECDSKRDALIRECHHLITEERIKYEVGPHCLEEQFIDDVALVSKAHTSMDLATIKDRTMTGQRLRLQLLAALLRLADELDLDCRRVDLDELSQAAISEHSKAHWWKCHYVESVDVLEDAHVRLLFRFSEDDGDEVAQLVPPLVLEKLHRELREEGLQGILRPHISVELDDPVRVEPDAVGKQPVPDKVLAIFKKDFLDLSMRRALKSIEPLELFGPGKVTMTFGEHPETAIRRAMEYWHEGRRAEAISVLEKSVSLAPDSAPLHGLLADAHVRMGKLEQAGARAQEAVRLNGGSFLGRLNLGIVLGLQGNYREALNHLRIAELASYSVSLQPADRKRLFSAIARSLAGLGDFWHARCRVEAISNAVETGSSKPDDALEGERLQLAAAISNELQGRGPEVVDWEVAEATMTPILSYWTPDPPFLYEYRSTLFPEGILLGGSSSWIDYDIECEFQILSRAAGFFLRADSYATTGLMMQFTFDKLRRHQELYSNYFLRPITEKSLPAPLERRSWYKARFEISDDRLDTYLDGQHIDTWTDFSDEYASGLFGFRLYVGEFALYRPPNVTVNKMTVDREEDDTGA